MEKVRPWCGQPSDRGRLKNRTAGSQTGLSVDICRLNSAANQLLLLTDRTYGRTPYRYIEADSVNKPEPGASSPNKNLGHVFGSIEGKTGRGRR